MLTHLLCLKINPSKETQLSPSTPSQEFYLSGRSDSQEKRSEGNSTSRQMVTNYDSSHLFFWWPIHLSSKIIYHPLRGRIPAPLFPLLRWCLSLHSKATFGILIFPLLSPMYIWGIHVTLAQVSGRVPSSPCVSSVAEHSIQRTGLDSEEEGVQTGGRNIHPWRCADDTILLAGSSNDLKWLLMKVKDKSAKAGLDLNVKPKTMTAEEIPDFNRDNEDI